MTTNKVLDLWAALQAGMSELDKDVQKNAVKNNVSAGVRVRKGLRDLRKVAAQLLKETLQSDKSTVGARKASRPASTTKKTSPVSAGVLTAKKASVVSKSR
jgi:Histone H1-like protein Hc1